MTLTLTIQMQVKVDVAIETYSRCHQTAVHAMSMRLLYLLTRQDLEAVTAGHMIRPTVTTPPDFTRYFIRYIYISSLLLATR